MFSDPRLARKPVYVAMALFGLASVLLLWPVSSSANYGGKVTFTPVGQEPGFDDSEFCGPALVQAFVAPTGPDDNRFERKQDCAAKARTRVGVAALFLFFAIPPTVVALLTPPRTSAKPVP